MATSDPLRISCGDCALEHTSTCDDCIVTFICSRPPDDALVVEVAELRALRTLGSGGLAPGLRHTDLRHTGPAAAGR